MKNNKPKTAENSRLVVVCAPTRVRKGRNAGGFMSRCVTVPLKR